MNLLYREPIYKRRWFRRVVVGYAYYDPSTGLLLATVNKTREGWWVSMNDRKCPVFDTTDAAHVAVGATVAARRSG